MPRLIGLVLTLVIASAITAPAAMAQGTTGPTGPTGPTAGPDVTSTPSARTLYESGPSGRFLVDGTWLYRADPTDAGLGLAWQRDVATDTWTQVQVPNAWNATDESLASYLGGVGWYRKDFRLPTASKLPMWIVRFESVNYRAKVWLNGQPIGTHAGAYRPFELRLPRGFLKLGAVNHLTIRIDSRRTSSDFPPTKYDAKGRPLGGWWNYGGILREVYLRRVDDIDVTNADIRPELPCATCAATVSWAVTVRNDGTATRVVTLGARFGARRVKLGTQVVGAKRFATFRATLRVPRPRLWSPSSPYLYDAPLLVTARKGKRQAKVQSYQLRLGVRSIKVSEGRLLLNGRALNVRGVGLQEDSRAKGFAIDNATRLQQLGWVRELGATLIRAHYPLHPYTLEQADRKGLLAWSEVPVYQVETDEIAKTDVRDAAVNALRSVVTDNREHPSVIVWSIGNELSARPGPAQASYIRTAIAAARALDPTRPIALAVAASPTVGCQTEYDPLDIIGLNDYFGWYAGANGTIADRDVLSGYLDALRACYPDKAIMISEFGAEANRDGPIEERGTTAFQRDFIAFHLGVYATKPWLSGAIYWALQEFRVRPDWDGGNPRPQSPIHQKGLVTLDGVRKPAFADVQAAFRATRQIASAAGR